MRKLARKCLFYVFLRGLAAWSCQDGFAHARQQKQGNRVILPVENLSFYCIKQTFKIINAINAYNLNKVT